MSRRAWRWALWIALLWLAAATRLPHANWDAGIAAHPDERFLLSVARQVAFWGDPLAVEATFPYGHFALYLARLLVVADPRAEVLFAARLFSGLIGVLLVAQAGAWGRLLAGERGAWCAALLMALAPFPIQQARFYTVDPLAACFAGLALLVAVRRQYFVAGILAGWTLACKISLIWLGVPLFAVALWQAGAFPHLGKIQLRWNYAREALVALGRYFRRCWPTLWRIGLGSVVGFVEVSPWAVLRFQQAWKGPLTQAAMVAGRLDYPYTRQYADTTPYLYPLGQMALWGLGPLVTLLGAAGVLYALWHWKRLSGVARIAWVWTWVYFLMTAALYVKFPRYLLPLYPFWAAWVAWLIWGREGARFRRWRWALTAATAGVTALFGVAQLSIYALPHPWETASRWVYDHVPTDAIVATEHWDHPLPVPLGGGLSSWRYQRKTLPVFDGESRQKLEVLEMALRDADAIILASRRGYGALVRLPERYPETLAWYRQLFTLPHRRRVDVMRCPRVGPLALMDDPLADAGLPTERSLAERCGTPFALRLPRLDESFHVYDAPTVTLFVKP